ncbi:hypothetical protein PHAVU_008G114100 [Phaseolus vulgaris]|uniref:Uncharacterized protein n=1 Tax=Phaseolus vulgaris TaxID=3885 RepID=V7B6H3_PHAVU|nr:hypothetical protein PHAVU_008G114100g [Phaseolus vulgaris]ESW12453.1 hypothetical protein PHAVU_008G114100g [Phaseolus vulgaris]
MGLNKPHVLMLLIIMLVSTTLIEGRTLSLISGQGYSKIFATLGVVCKCCDGGACTSTWTESCNNLQCYPWKSH